MMRVLRSCWLWLPLLLAGCGGSALTGGGIPSGRAQIEGVVVDALDPDRPVADAEVTLAIILGGETRTALFTAETRTDAAGAFLFRNTPEGEAILRVTPPRGMHGRPTLASVRLRGGDTASLALAIEPDAATATGATLTVIPERIETTLGTPVTVAATAMLANGQTVRPSWVVEGGIGNITPQGRFVPRRIGSGQIRVRAGDREVVVPVVVAERE
ncbi:MAG: carboxypeptidase regulatory-like domain-containing protein [Armatimonadetes bacterium]|nr:carboxypeptidase regulatory-like domain-containing protein [Armatimonadota bacterium]